MRRWWPLLQLLPWLPRLVPVSRCMAASRLTTCRQGARCLLDLSPSVRGPQQVPHTSRRAPSAAAPVLTLQLQSTSSIAWDQQGTVSHLSSHQQAGMASAPSTHVWPARSPLSQPPLDPPMCRGSAVTQSMWGHSWARLTCCWPTRLPQWSHEQKCARRHYIYCELVGRDHQGTVKP